MPAATPARESRVVWHESADEQAWIDAAASAVAEALRTALSTAAETRLLLSGGTTPAPVYRRLSEQPLDWGKVVVGLVDERDVEPDDEASNARLVRATLLRDAAAKVRFEPLREAGQPLSEAVSAANVRAASAPGDIAAIVLGMGDDGHTASLFPGAKNLEAALSSRAAYVLVDARGCAVADAYPQRISMTPSAIAFARRRILLIRGERKRAVFERAVQDGRVAELPVRAVIDAPGSPLHVYWCP